MQQVTIRQTEIAYARVLEALRACADLRRAGLRAAKRMGQRDIDPERDAEILEGLLEPCRELIDAYAPAVDAMEPVAEAAELLRSSAVDLVEEYAPSWAEGTLQLIQEDVEQAEAAVRLGYDQERFNELLRRMWPRAMGWKSQGVSDDTRITESQLIAELKIERAKVKRQIMEWRARFGDGPSGLDPEDDEARRVAEEALNGLKGQSYRLLDRLLRRRGMNVPYGALCQELWETDHLLLERLQQAVSKLRSDLKADYPEIAEKIECTGVGYLLKR